MLHPALRSRIQNRICSANITKFTLILLAVICTSATAITMNADFKGNWTFNEQKSKLGEGRFRMNAQSMKVSQEGDAMTIERTAASPTGENTTSTEKLSFDGKTAESTVFGNLKKKSTATWSQDGEQMTINSTIVFERDGNQFDIKVTETWKLTDGGKALSVDFTSTSQRGTTNNTFVYDKK